MVVGWLVMGFETGVEEGSDGIFITTPVVELEYEGAEGVDNDGVGERDETEVSDNISEEKTLLVDEGKEGEDVGSVDEEVVIVVVSRLAVGFETGVEEGSDGIFAPTSAVELEYEGAEGVGNDGVGERDESSFVKVTDTSVADGVTNTSVAEGVTNTSLADGDTNTPLADGVTNTTLADGVTNASAVAEGVTNTTLADRVTNTLLADGVTNTSLAAGVTNTSLADGVTNTSFADGVTNASAVAGEHMSFLFLFKNVFY